ncbi:hypothetical protein [Kitasatospora sp. NPDC004272]
MPDPTPWSAAVDRTAHHLTDLCDQLKDAPVHDRLHSLATLNAAFADLHHCAQREAVAAARSQGWTLRRIAAVLNCSHEQVRLLAP